MLQRMPESATSLTDTIPVRLESIRYAARDINLYEFVPTESRGLPAFEAGAHVDLHIDGIGVRQYSLVTNESSDGYLVAVKREPSGTGGSLFLHDTARVGMTFEVSAPRNNFPLLEDAPHSVLIAGGIGITPIRSMALRLKQIGASWELHFASRAPEFAAFADELSGYPQVRFHFDCDHSGIPIDIAALVNGAPEGAHFYCCGPVPMLDSFESAMSDVSVERKHVEYFASKHEAAAGGFTICLKRSGKMLPVPEGKSILDVLLEAGVSVPYSCADGICGACETVVVDGVPDHRDSVLTDTEKAQNKSMMVCCSGSHTDVLTLDL